MRDSTRLLWVGLLLGAWGCSGGDDKGEVTGTVWFNGKPLTSGTITFTDADETRSHSPIGPEGVYRVQGVKKGKARIGVVVHSRVPSGLSGVGGAARTPAKTDPQARVPKRYEDPATSGLTVEIRSGKQDHKIELVP